MRRSEHVRGGEMAEKKRSKKRDDSIKIDIGVGNLGVGGLFKGIQNLVDLVSELEKAGGEIKKEGSIDLSDLKEGMKGVFGFSIKTATGGKPVVEHFGNIKKTPRGAKVEEEREPITDVFDEKDEIRVYAEMPGVNENDIKMDLLGDILNISAKSGDKKYRKELLLPAKGKSETLASSFKNGILEITIKK
jgi:HSP20 family protein